MPIISAACHQVSFFAIARKITSCTFIVRSIAAFEQEPMLGMVAYSCRPQSGQITCYLNRTYHVLPTKFYLLYLASNQCMLRSLRKNCVEGA
jgi:hypothetical protein